MFKEKDRVVVRGINGNVRSFPWGGERVYTIRTNTPYITLYDVKDTYFNTDGIVIRTRNPHWKIGESLEFRYSHSTDLYEYLQKYIADEDVEALEKGLVELQYNGLVGDENALLLRITDALQSESPLESVSHLVTGYYSTVFQ